MTQRFHTQVSYVSSLGVIALRIGSMRSNLFMRSNFLNQCSVKLCLNVAKASYLFQLRFFVEFFCRCLQQNTIITGIFPNTSKQITRQQKYWKLTFNRTTINNHGNNNLGNNNHGNCNHGNNSMKQQQQQHCCATTQHNTTQHNTTQHNTTQHNTTQHNTKKLHNTTQLPDATICNGISIYMQMAYLNPSLNINKFTTGQTVR